MMVFLSVFFIHSDTNSTDDLPQNLPQVVVDPSGSVHINIPLKIPTGTRSVQPNLSLSYNSDSGNGLLGVGWNLSGLGMIYRSSVNGINYDDQDTFYSSLAGRLVYNSTEDRYQSQTESFIIHKKSGTCGSGPCSWIATDKRGTKYFFGSSDNSRNKQGDSVFLWALDKLEDLNGNSYSVEYTKSNGNLYPEKITYNNRLILFTYESRDDYSSNYSFQTLVETSNTIMML